jgi:hypothetical protein
MNFGGGIEFGNEELLGVEKRLCRKRIARS